MRYLLLLFCLGCKPDIHKLYQETCPFGYNQIVSTNCPTCGIKTTRGQRSYDTVMMRCQYCNTDITIVGKHYRWATNFYATNNLN